MENFTKKIGNEKGIALISMLLFLVVLTVIGLTSVSITSLENLTAMNERTYEQRLNEEEAGVGSQVNVLETTIANSALPAAYLSGAGGPVPDLAGPNLEAELTTNLTEDDSVNNVGALGPDLSFTLGTAPRITVVNMDIDYLFTRAKVGSALEFSSAYEGVGNSAASGGTEKIFRMTSQSTLKGATGAITNSYICVISGSCQK